MQFPTRNEFRYLLVVVDIFSRFVLVEPLKDANAETVRAALRRMFQANMYPLILSYNPGTEFAIVSRWFKSKGIRTVQGLIASKRITGAVEAINRSLRRSIERSAVIEYNDRSYPITTLIEWLEQAYEEAFN